jgi:hypothetical protein
MRWLYNRVLNNHAFFVWDRIILNKVILSVRGQWELGRLSDISYDLDDAEVGYTLQDHNTFL